MRLLLAALSSPAVALAQQSGAGSWSPVPSEQRIAFRVVWPEGTPANGSARLVMEAATRDRGPFSLAWSPFDAVYQPVDSSDVVDGGVIRLALPIDAEWTRVRLEADHMTMRPVFLDDVEVDRPAIVLRPEPAAVVRVQVDTDHGEWSASLAGRRFLVTQEKPSEHFESWWRTHRFDLVLDDRGRGRLPGVPFGATLAAGSGAQWHEVEPGASSATTAEGLAIGLHGLPLVVAEGPDPTWQLQPRRLATVVGRVVDVDGGARLQGLQVFRESTYESATVDDDGRFELLLWRPLDGQWNADVTIRASRFAPRTVAVPRPTDPDVTVDLGVIELRPHPSISGRLVFPDGRPAADFPLVVGTAYPKGGDEIRTDANGRFRVDRPASASMIVRGWSRLDDGVAHLVGPFRVDGGASDLELTVRPATPFIGNVEYDDGTPVSSIRIAAHPRGAPGARQIPQGGGELVATLPVIDGAFRWDGLPVGRWKIFVSTEGSKQTWQTLEHDAGRTPPFFQIPRPGAITGRVLTAAGEPVSGARVVARDGSGDTTWASTDATGNYRIEYLAAQSYTVRAWIRSARTEPVEGIVLASGAVVEGIDLTLPAGPVLTLTVVDADTGEAIRSRSVDVARGEDRLPSVSTSAQGVVRYGPLAPGVYRIRVRWQDRPTRASASDRPRVHTSFLTIERETPDLERTIEVW
ncbi:MAG: carboxypeptidase-like regulatory domain-containing protein [Planctomycetota bacterium]